MNQTSDRLSFPLEVVQWSNHSKLWPFHPIRTFRLNVILFTCVAVKEDIAVQECPREVSELIESIELLVVKSLIDTLLTRVAVQER